MQREVIKANIVVFIASFCTLVIELVAGRIMAPYVGVSLYTWTSIIGVVLAGISIGAYLGGLLADRYPRPSTLGWLLFLSGLGALSISPLTNLIGEAQFHTSLMIRILLITTIIFFVPSCLLGMISPVVVKLTLKNLQKTGNVVGKIYAFSTLGSIFGTFATGFFLISWMGTRHILLTMGIILILSALVFGDFFVRHRALTLFFILLSFFLIFPLVGFYTYAVIYPGEMSLSVSPIQPLKSLYGYAFKPPLDEETYFFKESDYYTIKLKRSIRGNNGNPLESLVLDHLVHSYTDLSDPLYLEYEYIRIYEEMVRWQSSKRKSFKVLFLGGGGYTFPRFIEAKYPKAEVEVVEIDPQIIRVSKEYLGISKKTKIRSINEDGRWFVMNCKEKESYDFIFGDAFNDLSIPYHLTTKEFAAQLKRLLKPNGLLLTNVIDSFERGDFMPSYIRTLEEVFGKGNVHLLTLSSNYDHIGISTCVVVASPKGLDMEGFVKAVKGNGDKEITSHVMPQDRLQQYLKERPSVILTDDYVPVDNLIAPIFEERFGYQR
jgi:predicted membrane-bound spermidine synthase